jgi:WD40 repeat protein
MLSLWDLRAKDPAANPVVLRGNDYVVRAVAISPDNRWVVAGSEDNTARLWCNARGSRFSPLSPRGIVGGIQFRHFQKAASVRENRCFSMGRLFSGEEHGRRFG